MGITGRRTERNVNEDSNSEPESSLLLQNTATSNKIPKDSFNLAYIIHFTLGFGYLLPWNAFITAIDYFSFLYPSSSVDRVFGVVNMTLSLISLLFILVFAHKSSPHFRINLGLILFALSLVMVPIMDMVYIKGRVGLNPGFALTVGAVAVCGVADGLVQGGVLGSAGQLPERYTQAVLAGTAASGVLVSLLRILTKAMYPQDAHGLRTSANLYFSVSIVAMLICILLNNVVHKLPIVKYYKDLKAQAVDLYEEDKGPLIGFGSAWTSTLWHIVESIKWYGIGVVLIYLVTLSIFPGYITEDVHSSILKDWYSILLITGYNVFDLVGKSLTALYVVEDFKFAFGGCVARLLFFPLFFVCLHGPPVFRTEIPVTLLTCLMGLTNGYLTSVLMMLAPKAVQLQHAETAGTLMVLFLVTGLAAGSVVSWLWVI